MSICFQKGVGGTRRGAPLLWGYFIRRDWKRAADELMNGFKLYVSRRRIEGALLAKIVK